MKHFISISILLFILITSFTPIDQDDSWERVIDLKGFWKFSVGDSKIWADTYFNDKNWEKIYVPSPWEDEGFRNHDGYAWYRTTFDADELKGKEFRYTLNLGKIDDVDEVFLNGHKIAGSGSFSPSYQTAYNVVRSYNIPSEFINFSGRNVIAVRVYDEGGEGGIVSGNVGIYTNTQERFLDVNLRGAWEFKITGRRFVDEGFDKNLIEDLQHEEGWSVVQVPSRWEQQGYAHYDGGGWYKKKFAIPRELSGQDVVLLMGKIDDSDQTYLNGIRVGSSHEEYNKFRVYNISRDQIKPGEINTLLVYVHDSGGDGGIYEGPVGIMKQSTFTKYIRWK